MLPWFPFFSLCKSSSTDLLRTIRTIHIFRAPYCMHRVNTESLRHDADRAKAAPGDVHDLLVFAKQWLPSPPNVSRPPAIRTHGTNRRSSLPTQQISSRATPSACRSGYRSRSLLDPAGQCRHDSRKRPLGEYLLRGIVAWGGR